jgi:hypothetical protein
MTQKMMRLFNTLAEARTYIKNDQSISLAKAKEYVERNTVLTNGVAGNKIWVILP